MLAPQGSLGTPLCSLGSSGLAGLADGGLLGVRDHDVLVGGVGQPGLQSW